MSYATENSSADFIFGANLKNVGPYDNFAAYQMAYESFVQKHNAIINKINTDLNSYKLEVKTLKHNISRKESTINDLKQKYSRKEQEIKNYMAQHTDMNMEIKTLRTNLNEMESKYSALEIRYDDNIVQKTKEIDELTNNLRTQNMISNEKERQLLAEKNDLARLCENYRSQIATLESKQSETTLSLSNTKSKLKDLEKEFNTFKMNSVNEAELKLNKYNAELDQYKIELKNLRDVIKKAENEKQEIELSKNKIIEEQNYKIRKIEYTLVHPVNPVSPNVISKNTGILKPRQSDPIFEDAESNEQTPSSTQNTVATVNNGSRATKRKANVNIDELDDDKFFEILQSNAHEYILDRKRIKSLARLRQRDNSTESQSESLNTFDHLLPKENMSFEKISNTQKTILSAKPRRRNYN